MEICEADKNACGSLTPRSSSPSAQVRSIARPVSEEIEDTVFNSRDIPTPLAQNARLERIYFSAISQVPEDVSEVEFQPPNQQEANVDELLSPNLKDIGTDPIIFTDSQGSEKSVEVIDGPLKEAKQEMMENFFLFNDGKKKSSGAKNYYCSACDSCRASSCRYSDFSEFSLPSLSLNNENQPRVLPSIQWVMVKFMPEYGRNPWHPRAQIALNASPNNIQRFGNVVKGESHGTACLIIAMSTARKAKFSIIYCGISGDNVNNAQDGSVAWSNRMSVHLKSKLFADFKEIGFVKLLEGAPADKIRKWEWGMVYSKNLIDKRVTEYFEDYPSNDDYSLNLLNSEYPFKDLNIASFSIEQANEYLDEAIARAVNALKDTVPIWREIKQ
uniref:Nucleoside phosphorylase domain-containing protein n=1 Tax=Ditylenchus dipsaci TaxID=166011 RepID=A0A915EGH9_9BILA